MSITTNAVLEREEKLQAKFQELYDITTLADVVQTFENWIASLSEDEYQEIVK